MVPSFHNADKPTHRRVMVIGLLLCAVFVIISFSLRTPPENDRVLVKADKLMHTAASSCVPRARRKKLTDGVRPRRLPRRRFIRTRVHGRNRDETGVADDIKQNFHPDRHGKALVRREFPGDVFRSAGPSAVTSDRGAGQAR
jgi:hypothetical protein